MYYFHSLNHKHTHTYTHKLTWIFSEMILVFLSVVSYICTIFLTPYHTLVMSYDMNNKSEMKVAGWCWLWIYRVNVRERERKLLLLCFSMLSELKRGEEGFLVTFETSCFFEFQINQLNLLIPLATPTTRTFVHATNYRNQ